MDRNEVIRLAYEADPHCRKIVSARSMVGDDFLMAFAALVAAAERERMVADGWRQCAKGQKTTQFCGIAEEALRRAETSEAECAALREQVK